MADERWLGPQPSRRNIPKYGDYLRRKAELFQAKVIDTFSNVRNPAKVIITLSRML